MKRTFNEMSEWIAHIRTRPEMYIGNIQGGSHPKDGVYTMLHQIMTFCLDEHRKGFGNRIVVDLKDEHTLAIRDFSRGIAFEKLLDFVTLDNRDEDREQSTLYHRMGYNGYGFAVVNALSARFELSSFRDGVVQRVLFEKGVLIGSQSQATLEKNGIKVVFTLDKSISDNFMFSENMVFTALRYATYLNKGLEIVFDGTSLRSDNGLSDLLEAHKPYKDAYLYPIIRILDEDMEIAFTHSRLFGETFSFVNGFQTLDGGTHLTAFKEIVSSVILALYPEEKFVKEDVFYGLCGAVSIQMKEVYMEQGNPWELFSVYHSREPSCTLHEWMDNVLRPKLQAYFNNNPDACTAIHEIISYAKEQREFSQTCMAMDIPSLVELWNDGVTLQRLNTEQLHSIINAFHSKKVKTVHMQRGRAVPLRKRIRYDESYAIIYCEN